MKRPSFILLLTLAAAACLSSCQSSLETSPKEILFKANALKVLTKNPGQECTNKSLRDEGFAVTAIFDNNKSIAFNDGFFYDPKREVFNNITTRYFFLENEPMSFYGVYPSHISQVVENGEVRIDYFPDDNMDLCVAKLANVSETSDPVMLTFSHILSQVTIKIQGEDKALDYTLKKASLTVQVGSSYHYSTDTWNPIGPFEEPYVHEVTVFEDNGGMALSTEEMTDVGTTTGNIPGKATLNLVWVTSDSETPKEASVDIVLDKGMRTEIEVLLETAPQGIEYTACITDWEEKVLRVKTREEYKPELVEGVFTVNADGKKVKFTKGNLYYNGNSYCCENSQYDGPNFWAINHISHFIWTKDDSFAHNVNYHDTTASATDTLFAAEGKLFKGFTVLTDDEWEYVLANALAKNSSGKNLFAIKGRNCVILKPDGYDGTVADTYTADEWALAESQYGLVALPCEGKPYSRENREIIEGVNVCGYYWTGTNNDADRAYYVCFDQENVGVNHFLRSDHYCIRLLQLLKF